MNVKDRGEVDRIRDQGKREREGNFFIYFFFQCLLIFECSAVVSWFL